MHIPPLQGNLNQSGFFLYAAADPTYFDAHARPLIRSIRANTPNYGCHIHIYNPRADQIEFCQQHGSGYSWEEVTDFGEAAAAWHKRSWFDNDRQQQMHKKAQTLPPAEFNRLIQNTYFACMRFVRLAELLSSHNRCLSIDVDGLVRKKFVNELGSQDFYLYEKPKDGTHLAGAILFNAQPGTQKFLQQYAQELRNAIEANDIYWFLDQWVLDRLVPQYRKGLLPMSYIDWAMRPDSAIWSAKGKRKELAVFTQEQQRYS